MSRILVATDDRTVAVLVDIDAVTGDVTAFCEGCSWTTEPGRVDGVRDVIEEAGIHVDQAHR